MGDGLVPNAEKRCRCARAVSSDWLFITCRRFPTTLSLRLSAPRKRSWANISQIRTLAAERIGRRIGRVGAEEMAHVVERLMEIVEQGPTNHA
ncbi:MAG: type II toxin-antitoxin system PemK/MazF family toxin [Candidatus Omnitrophota bacterium]